MEYDGGGRRKMVTPINLSDFRRNGSCTFEVAGMDDVLELDQSDQVEELARDHLESQKKFFEGISLKNVPVVHYSAEETLKDFDEYEITWEEVGEGVRKKLIKPGRGASIEAGAKVSILYTAIAELADEPFDEYSNPRRPFRFRIGEENVLSGLDTAVRSMRSMEVSKFLLQPNVAYGKLGHPPRIPADSKVLFTIEVVESKMFAKDNKVFEMTEEERQELPFHEIIKAAEELKDDGNKEFKRKEYSEAVSLYSKSATMLESYTVVTVRDEDDRNELLYKLLNNLAMCYDHLGAYKKAIKACESALTLPVSMKKDKPYYRMGKVYHVLGKLQEAREMLEKALDIDNQNYETAQLYEKVLIESNLEDKERDSLYKKMMKKI